ncbi:MAG TPA: sugar ABC transporter substrate-binding protein [Solirubrobacterales bacterium]|jgi:ribose transport system substrate-binding protein|nr:sugar ABC transporter substrate-binding protein [Solirubrobacterales bacterium]
MPIRQSGSSRRRSLIALLGAAALLLAVVLSACGSSSSSSSTSSGGGGGESESSTKASEVHIAVVTASTTQNAFQEMAYGAEAAAAHAGVEITSSAPNGVNPTAEVSQFQAATQTAKDGVTIMTTAPEDFVRPYKQAVEEGVPVVTMDSPPPEGSGVETFVGNSNTTIGEDVARQLIKEIPANESGEVVFGNDIPGLILLELRIKGMENVLKKERPNLKIVGPFNVGSEPTENYNNWNNLVKAHPNAVAYMAPGDQDAVSLFKIQKQNDAHYLVAACDVDPIALEAVAQGYVNVLGDPYHYMKGYISATLLAEHALTGKEIPKGWWNPGSGLVTKENVAEIEKRESSTQARDEFFEPIAEEELANPTKYIKPISDLN